MGIDMAADCLGTWAANTGGRAVHSEIGVDTVEWPEARSDLHVHFSPACTQLSKARGGSAAQSDVDGALAMIRHCMEVVVAHEYTSWSLENVSTPAVVALVKEMAEAHPLTIAYTVVDAADYGTASNRLRLIAANPALIKRLREQPTMRVTVAEAFAAAGRPLPAAYIRSNTSNRDGSSCVRSVQQPAFCVTASHPLTWSDREGVTVRCLTVEESAICMGFPSHWVWPRGSRAGIRAVGNAVPPPLAAAIMRAAIGVPAEAATTCTPPRPSASRKRPHQPHSPTSTASSALEARVAALERLLSGAARALTLQPSH